MENTEIYLDDIPESELIAAGFLWSEADHADNAAWIEDSLHRQEVEAAIDAKITEDLHFYGLISDPTDGDDDPFGGPSPSCPPVALVPCSDPRLDYGWAEPLLCAA